MKKLSTGQDSTLANWRALSATFFGEASAPTDFLDERIKKEGADSEVIADERQFIQVLGELWLAQHKVEKKPNLTKWTLGKKKR